MLQIINKLGIPKVILRYLMINFIDIDSIAVLVLHIKEMNILDDKSKEILLDSRTLYWKCMHGEFESILRYCDKYKNLSYKYHFDSESFYFSCLSGNLDLAKWIYSLDSCRNESTRLAELSTYDSNMSLVFIQVCSSGLYDVAKWLYSIDDKFNMHSNINDAFATSCISGYLDIAKWLFSIGASHREYQYIFKWSCCNGHLDVASWLYSLAMEKIDICACYDFVFNFNKNRLEVLEWLRSKTKLCTRKKKWTTINKKKIDNYQQKQK